MNYLIVDKIKYNDKIIQIFIFEKFQFYNGFPFLFLFFFLIKIKKIKKLIFCYFLLMKL